MSLGTYPQAARRQRLGRMRMISVTAPVGGWNTRDSLDQMDPTDAVVLDNWIPKINGVESRKGYETLVASIATDIGGTWSDGPVETLMTMRVGSNEYMLAAMDTGLARVDTGTATQVAANGTFTNNRWQYTVFADSTAPNTPQILMVNGADTPQTWDGTTLAAWTGTGTGLTPANVIWCNAFKNRLFVGEANTRDFFYGNLGALGGAGAFTRFPLSGVRGAQGSVLFMATMTRDTGSGPDDFAVFVTDAGQAIVYAGTDPGGSTLEEWQLVGVYQIPNPINSRRAYAQLFGDVVVATDADYVFLAETIQSGGSVLLRPSKLTGAMQEASTSYGENYGWEMLPNASDGLMLSNIPKEESAQFEQHCINLQTRAASRFTGWNMVTLGRLDDRFYGGGTSGQVYRLLSGRSDDADGTETRISLRAQTAWTTFNSPQIKHVRAVRPIMKAQGALTYAAAVGVDFKNPNLTAKVSDGPAGATTLWGDTAGVTTLWGDT